MPQHLRDIGTPPRIVETDPPMSRPLLRILLPRGWCGGTTRLSAFYAASFLLVGIQLPFWPVWLSGRGLSAPQIALVFTAAIWAKVAVTPLLGAVADRSGRRRPMMTGLAAITCIAYALLLRDAGIWPLLALNLVAAVAQATLMPIGDSITLAIVRERSIDYGRVRVWGSVSFVVAAAGGGAALAAIGGGTGNSILALVLVAAIVLLAACIAMPELRAPTAPGRSRWGALGWLAADREFWLFAASAAMLQASHQLYYGFGTLYWRSLGFSTVLIGGLWAEGVVAEIALFWYSAPLVARIGPLGLMVVGGIAGIVRWSLTCLVHGGIAAIALQSLHALTFGATHLGAMHFLARRMPLGAASSGQSLYSALSAGLGSGLVMLIAGSLYAAYGGYAYPFMALLSTVGLGGVLCLRRLSRQGRAAEC